MDLHEVVADILRRLRASVAFGTVCESQAEEGKALVRVAIGERVTRWLPVAMVANDFVRIWIPPRVGMQVTVLFVGGEPDFGVVIPAIFNIGCKEPAGAGAQNAIVEIGSVRMESDGRSVALEAPESVELHTPVVRMGGDLEVAGDITDSRGNLTAHTHATTDGATAKER